MSTLQRALASGSLQSAAAALAAGQFSAVQLLAEAERRANDTAHLNIFVTRTSDLALRAAEQSDARRAHGESLGELDGVPVAVKDNFCMLGVRTTAASNMLRRYVPAFESTMTARLREAGAVIVGKTNMDEFGMGSFTTHSAHGATVSPLTGLDKPGPRSAGGSSGGSAAAVAAGTALAAIGSDTGGSVRLPAAFCGLVGFKPTYGSLSRWGLVAYASSLDTPGFLTRTVDDAAVLFRLLQGVDARDARSIPAVQCSMPAPRLSRPLRIGIPKEYAAADLSLAATETWRRAANLLRGMGHTVVDVSLPCTQFALATYYVVAPAEAASNLARFNGTSFGEEEDEAALDWENLPASYARLRAQKFGAEVQRRILLGTYATSSDAISHLHGKAMAVRRRVTRDFADAFAIADVLLTPTAPNAAPLLSDVAQLSAANAYASDVMTVPASLAGLPALSLPSGCDPLSGLPLGLQLISARGSEGLLLQCASDLERGLESAG